MFASDLSRISPIRTVILLPAGVRRAYLPTGVTSPSSEQAVTQVINHKQHLHWLPMTVVPCNADHDQVRQDDKEGDG